MSDILNLGKDEANINKIVDYIKAGASDKQTLGVELEHFVVDDELKPASYDILNNILLSAAKEGGNVVFEGDNAIGLQTKDYAISLEPACQLEISINPREKISDIEEIYNSFIKVWEPIIKATGFHMITKGVHPLVESGLCDPHDFPLIPKKRYEYMDKYFEKSGKHGVFMMRATGSTQVSIDYINEADAIRKYHFACVLSPIFALISQNQSHKGIRKEWEKNLLRCAIWNDTDKVRCGYFKDSLNRSYTFYDYAKHIYESPMIVGLDKEGKAFYTEKSVKELLMDEERVFNEHILSMFFPNVRFKQYIEIRMADAMPKDKMLGYAALIKGLFYSEKTLCRLRKEFSAVRNEKDIYEAEEAIMKEGYDAHIYGRLGKAKKCKDFVEMIFEEAESNLSAEEQKYLEVLKPF